MSCATSFGASSRVRYCQRRLKLSRSSAPFLALRRCGVRSIGSISARRSSPSQSARRKAVKLAHPKASTRSAGCHSALTGAAQRSLRLERRAPSWSLRQLGAIQTSRRNAAAIVIDDRQSPPTVLLIHVQEGRYPVALVRRRTRASLGGMQPHSFPGPLIVPKLWR